MVRETVKNVLRKARLLNAARRMRGFFCLWMERAAGLAKFFVRPAVFDPLSVRRVLAIRLDRVGDLVLTTPALRAIKESYPNCRLSVLVRRYVRDLVVGLPFIDEVIVAEDFPKRSLVRRLREGGFDVSLGFHPDARVNCLPWRAGISYRVGYGHCGSGIFLTDRIADDRGTRIRHEVVSALEVASRIGAKTGDLSLSVAVREDSEAFANRFFQENGLSDSRVVVIHPGSRQSYIRWPKDRFSRVADRLVRESGVRVLLVGGPEERETVVSVKELMGEPAVLAIGPTLSRLISLIKRARVFIGNSTGPMHIAAALKVPVVAIFGSRNPRDSFQEWGPWGNGHAVIIKDTSCATCHPGDCQGSACLEAVTVDDVVKAALEKL